MSNAIAELLNAPGVEVTANRCGPLTWQEGKSRGFALSQQCKTILVAGDSPNDFAMQFLTPMTVASGSVSPKTPDMKRFALEATKTKQQR